MISKGFFITLEGGEGSGKSTLLRQLSEYLTSKGYEVIKTREPGGTPLGETIRGCLLNQDDSLKISAQAELLLFLAARAQHIEEVIRPGLESGKIILCDRFNDSTIAYQGAARQLDLKYVQRLCHMICNSVEPQLTLFLDVDPNVGLLRSKRMEKDQAASGQLDRIEAEDIEFHRHVQEGFRSLARHEPFRIYSIDANKPQNHVLREAIRAIDELVLLPNKRL